MSILCKLMGHKHPENLYGKLSWGPIDSVGRIHMYVKAECSRCGELYNVGRAHLPSFANRRHKSAVMNNLNSRTPRN